MCSKTAIASSDGRVNGGEGYCLGEGVPASPGVPGPTTSPPGRTLAFGPGRTGVFGLGTTGVFGAGTTCVFGAGTTATFGDGVTDVFGLGRTAGLMFRFGCCGPFGFVPMPGLGFGVGGGLGFPPLPPSGAMGAPGGGLFAGPLDHVVCAAALAPNKAEREITRIKDWEARFIE